MYDHDAVLLMVKTVTEPPPDRILAPPPTLG